MKITKNILIFIIQIPAFILYPNITFILSLILLPFIKIKPKYFYFIISFSIFYLAYLTSLKEISGTGNDFYSYYYNIVNNSYPPFLESFTDSLYWYVSNTIFNLLDSPSHKLFFFIISLISLIPFIFLFSYIDKISSTELAIYSFAFFMLFFISSLSFWNLYGNYIRQAWAFSYSILTFLYIVKKRYILALTISAPIALLSHSSGFFIIFSTCIPLFFNNNLNFIFIKIISLLLILLIYFFPPLNYIEQILPYYVTSKINFYINWTGSNFGDIAITRLTIMFLFLYVIDLYIKPTIENLKLYLINKKILSSYILLFIISLTMIPIPKIIERTYYPALILAYIYLSITIAAKWNYHVKLEKIVFVILFPMLISLMFFSFYKTIYYNPYHFSGSLNKFLFYQMVNLNE